MVEQEVIRVGGCKEHGQTKEDVDHRWVLTKDIIEDAVSFYENEDEAAAEWYAQWTGVDECDCCVGPCKKPDTVCKPCQ